MRLHQIPVNIPDAPCRVPNIPEEPCSFRQRAESKLVLVTFARNLSCKPLALRRYTVHIQLYTVLLVLNGLKTILPKIRKLVSIRRFVHSYALKGDDLVN